MVKRLRLSDLPDELILKIFSMLPNFKESVATHLISKQHEDPYKLVPDFTLEYNNEESFVTFMSFAYGSLLSDDDQILQRFHLKLVRNYSASDINFCVQVAASIADLLHSCLDLEYLVLNQTSFDYWERVCLSSLKSLHLLSARCYSSDSLTRLLQSCPVLEYLVLRDLMSMHVILPESIATLLKTCASLEDLVITRTRYDDVSLYDINVPTLKSLTINNSIEKRTHDAKESRGFWINALALETLNIKDTVSDFLMLDFMPEVTKANIQVTCDQSEGFLGSLTSIQHLSLCSRTSETPYPSGSVFPYLGHLELCTCSLGWANLLALLLNDAPGLHSLKLKSNHSAPYDDPKNFWEEPAVVPECLLTQLEICEWRQYENTVQHRKVAAYILANATCLKMATFSTRRRDKDHLMLMELKKLNKVSETCQLVFE